MLVRILIALPDDRSLAECCAELASCGYAVEQAKTGLDCLERLNAFEFDVMIVNADLRWGSGVGVVEVLADDPELRHLPVVLLTTGITADDHRNIVACVPGPYEPGTLPRLLEQLFPNTECTA